MKFGMVMQIAPLQGTVRWNFEFLQNQDGGGRYLEKSYHRDNVGVRNHKSNSLKWLF